MQRLYFFFKIIFRENERVSFSVPNRFILCLKIIKSTKVIVITQQQNSISKLFSPVVISHLQFVHPFEMETNSLFVVIIMIFIHACHDPTPIYYFIQSKKEKTFIFDIEARISNDNSSVFQQF